MGEKRNAEHIVWDAPGDIQMSLVPEPGGWLQVEVENGVVTITGEQCQHRQGEHAKKPKDVGRQILSEVQMALLTTHCQITWKAVVEAEKTKDQSGV
jgi:hypothetical protein